VHLPRVSRPCLPTPGCDPIITCRQSGRAFNLLHGLDIGHWPKKTCGTAALSFNIQDDIARDRSNQPTLVCSIQLANEAAQRLRGASAETGPSDDSVGTTSGRVSDGMGTGFSEVLSPGITGFRVVAG
jgi:hypothetical protein